MSVNQNDDEESVINSEEEMEGQSEFSSDDEKPILLPRENKRQRRPTQKLENLFKICKVKH